MKSKAASPTPPERASLSIVVPVFNEEDNVELLYAEIEDVLRGYRWELIFVDDGSTDNTLARLERLMAEDPRVRILKLSKNFGQTAALQAGFDAARQPVIVTLDGDLQNDPRDIPRLLAVLEEGYDVVSGWRKDRKDRALTRRAPSIVANWLIAKVSGVPIRDNGCSLKAYRREVIEKTAIYSDMHRYLVPMMSLSGARIKEIVVNHRPRRFGRSKYGLSRILAVSLDLLMLKMLLRFTSHPASWFAILGFPFVLISIVSLGWALLLEPIAVRTSDTRLVVLSIIAVSAFAAFYFMIVGMLAELAVTLGDFKEAESILQNIEVSPE